MTFGIDPYGIPYIPTYEDAKNLEYEASPWKRGANKGLLPVCTDEDGKPKRTYLTIRREPRHIKGIHPSNSDWYVNGNTNNDRYMRHTDDIVIKLYDTDILRYQWTPYNTTNILLNYNLYVTSSTNAVLGALLRLTFGIKDGQPVARVHTRTHGGRVSEQPQWAYLKDEGTNELCNLKNALRANSLFVLENPATHHTHTLDRKKMNALRSKYRVDDFLKYYVTPMDKLRDGYALEEFLSTHPNTKDLPLDDPDKAQLQFMEECMNRSDYGIDYVDADLKLLDRIQEARSKEDMDPIEHQLLLLTLAQRCGLFHRSKYPNDEQHAYWSRYNFQPTRKNTIGCMKKFIYDCIKIRHADEVFIKTTYNGDAKADMNIKYINAQTPDHPRYTVKCGEFGDYVNIIDIT
jgi:hypothetical protein